MDEDKPWLKPNQYAELPGGICCQRAMGKFCYEHNPDNYLPDVPTGQIPSAENQRKISGKSAENQSLMLLQLNGLIDEIDGVLNTETHATAKQWLSYVRSRIERIVKAVAADTNEECETASQAHTGTKD